MGPRGRRRGMTVCRMLPGMAIIEIRGLVKRFGTVETVSGS